MPCDPSRNEPARRPQPSPAPAGGGPPPAGAPRARPAGAAEPGGPEPKRATEALAAISSTGRQALAEMRRLLGVLRSGDSGAGLAPQPGLEQLRELLDQARAEWKSAGDGK